jgi:hypothetical protein
MVLPQLIIVRQNYRFPSSITLGHVDNSLADWFAPLSATNEPNGEATLTGPVQDQAELFGLLMKLYNLNFTLISVQRK